MGCGISKLEPGEVPASGFRSFRPDMTRRRSDGPRARKDSIVSTTGLLHPEEYLDDVVGAGPSPADCRTATTTAPPHVVAKCLREEQGEESKKKRAGAGGEEEDVETAGAEKIRKGGGEGVKRAPCSRGPKLTDGRRARSGNDEEMPGSPSFRIYFVDSAREYSDDDSVDSSAVDGNTAGKITGKKFRPIREDSLKSITSSEESEGKLSKRRKGASRLRGLTKRPAGAVYGLLNVRSCYSIPNTGCHVQEGGLPPPPSSHSSTTIAGRISSAGGTAPGGGANINHSSVVSEKVVAAG